MFFERGENIWILAYATDKTKSYAAGSRVKWRINALVSQLTVMLKGCVSGCDFTYAVRYQPVIAEEQEVLRIITGRNHHGNK
ncbi:MAG: hypothetical protein ACRC8O_13940 [Plesiomonas shigelloides]